MIQIGLERIGGNVLALAQRNDLFKFVRADQRIHFRQVLLNVSPIPLHQAAGDDQFLGPAGLFVLGHLEDGVDRFLLRRVNKTTGVDDDNFGLFGMRGELMTGSGELTHHYFRIDEVFRTTETDKSDFQA